MLDAAWAPGPGAPGAGGLPSPPRARGGPPPSAAPNSLVLHAATSPWGPSALSPQLGCPRASGQDAEGPCLPLSRGGLSGGAHAGPWARTLFPPGAPGRDAPEQEVSPLLFPLPCCAWRRRILNRRTAGS